MQAFFEQYRKLIIFAGVSLLAGFGFLLLMRADTSSTANVSLGTDIDRQIELSEQIERELIQELAKLRTITLSENLFQSDAFSSLLDYSRRIEERPRGRDNPFAPFQ
jgi:hypothetical protein